MNAIVNPAVGKYKNSGHVLIVKDKNGVEIGGYPRPPLYPELTTIGISNSDGLFISVYINEERAEYWDGEKYEPYPLEFPISLEYKLGDDIPTQEKIDELTQRIEALEGRE